MVWGVTSFVVLMILSVIVLCFFPEIATWFADLVMGRGGMPGAAVSPVAPWHRARKLARRALQRRPAERRRVTASRAQKH